MNTNEILATLRQPLDMSRVKRRQAGGKSSDSVPYLEGYDVIERANEIFGFAWSFDLISEPVIRAWPKRIMVWNEQARRKLPQMDPQGNPMTEDVGMVYVTGRVTVELDGKSYSHGDIGRCGFTGDTPEALDMALAGAATDCLKRCFRQLGDQFGLSLYDKEIAASAGREDAQSMQQQAKPVQQAQPKPAPAPVTPTNGKPVAALAHEPEPAAPVNLVEYTRQNAAPADPRRLTIEEAEAETSSEGMPYGGMDTNALRLRANSLLKKSKEPGFTDERRRKLAALELIIKARSEGRQVQK